MCVLESVVAQDTSTVACQTASNKKYASNPQNLKPFFLHNKTGCYAGLLTHYYTNFNGSSVDDFPTEPRPGTDFGYAYCSRASRCPLSS